MLRIRPALSIVAALFVCAAPAQAASHGDLSSSKSIKTPTALKSAAKNYYVTYKSQGVDGKLVKVSGTVAIPKGKAPKGGWPIFSWAHGSTGIADACAPSADPGKGALSGYSSYVNPFLNRVVKAGFVVVRTDYEGQGTPGDHPYLNGLSEGRAVLDIARAARKLNKSVSRHLVLGGHSQGGHAALWAAAIAKKWTPDLKLGGTAAFAPASHLGEQAGVIRSLDSTGLSPLIGIILRGAAISQPSLNIESMLTDRALAVWPDTLTKCLPDLGAATSWGGLKATEILRPEADITGLVAYLNANDPESLKFKGKVLVLQGLADTTVMPIFTDPLVSDLKAGGTTVSYKKYKGIDHGGIAVKPQSTGDALKFIERAAK